MAKAALHRADHNNLYEQDFHAWLLEQAAHARGGRTDALDLENIAEELEGLARADRREIRNRMEVLVAHLLKLAYGTARRPRRGWTSTAQEQRRRIGLILDDSPSLRSYPGHVLSGAYAAAVESLEGEPGLPPDALPATCPFSIEQVLDRRFIP